MERKHCAERQNERAKQIEGVSLVVDVDIMFVVILHTSSRVCSSVSQKKNFARFARSPQLDAHAPRVGESGGGLGQVLRDAGLHALVLQQVGEGFDQRLWPAILVQGFEIFGR